MSSSDPKRWLQTLNLLAAAILVAGLPAPAFALYNQNAPAKFKTEHRSRYFVEATRTCRISYRGGETSGWQGKNIYYGSEEDTERMLELYDQGAQYRVESGRDPDIYYIHFDTASEPSTFAVHLRPQIGGTLYPVDMLLKEDGYPQRRDRFHVGDAVTEFIEQNPPPECNGDN